MSDDSVSRRGFLGMLGASLAGTGTASARAQGTAAGDMAQTGQSGVGPFVNRYIEILNIYTRTPAEVPEGDHIAYGEIHGNMDAMEGFTELVRREQPDAIGIEFGAQGDDMFRQFSDGDVGPDAFYRHIVNTGPGRAGYIRDQEQLQELVAVSDEHDIAWHGLEPYKFEPLYPTGDREEPGFRERADAVAVNGAQLMNEYDQAFTFSGVRHAHDGVNLPGILLDAAEHVDTGDIRSSQLAMQMMTDPFAFASELEESPVRRASLEEYREVVNNPETYRIAHRAAEPVTGVKGTSTDEQYQQFTDFVNRVNEPVDQEYVDQVAEALTAINEPHDAYAIEGAHYALFREGG